MKKAREVIISAAAVAVIVSKTVSSAWRVRFETSKTKNLRAFRGKKSPANNKYTVAA